ncbi:MAG: alcohol dehydrogenase, partial [Thermofilum sp. ex4484_15]
MRAAVLKAEWSPRPGYKLTEEESRTRKVKMGSRVWRNPKLELEDIPVPELGPYEVLVRVKACGICGSDIHMVETDGEGYMLYPGLTKLPVVPGHELSGVVEKIGSKVTAVKPGDMVMSEEMLWCGRCYYCRSGFLNQCVNLEELGFTLNGGFEEYFKVDEKYLWKIDSLLNAYKTEDAAYEAGSLVEPTAVSYNAMFIRAGGFKPGAYVVV